VGEIGLDYYWKEPDRQVQKEWFGKQLQLAQEVGLPVILHSREAAKDTLDIVKERYQATAGGVVHCFSYTKEIAWEYLDMGFYIGVGGVPIERILLETDSPYLAPAPHRGKRNSSLNLTLIAKEIARIKGMDYDEVVEITMQNAKRLFGIA